MGFLSHTEVAVAKQNDGISLTVDDPVDKVFPAHITHQSDASAPELALLERPESDLVAAVHDERVHAVALDGDGHAHALGDHASDLLHHHRLFYHHFLCHPAVF